MSQLASETSLRDDNIYSIQPLAADNSALSQKRAKTATRKRRSKRREAGDLGAFIRRMHKALVARAAGGDLEAVEVLAGLARSCALATKQAADAAWRSGYSYTEIGDALGISRQAARQRFGARPDK